MEIGWSPGIVRGSEHAARIMTGGTVTPSCVGEGTGARGLLLRIAISALDKQSAVR
jgi:hypothetical protein